MSSPYGSQDSFAYGLYDQFKETQTQGTDVASEGLVPDGSRDNTIGTDPSTQQRMPGQSEKLDFCPLSEWDKENTYDEDPPSYIHYLIEWKVTVNNRVVSKDTEQDVVLAPAVYWRIALQPKLEKLLCRKLAKNRPVRSEDTNVVISVTERSQRDLAKRFEDTNVDWSVVERQVVSWSDFFRAGKKLRVYISFNYVETSQPLATSSRKTGKRGASSTTQQMLAERDTQLEAERESSGQPSIWRDVYELMRCPQRSCNSGPHCWRDPLGKKHYKLTTHHLRSLIQHVEQGLVLQTHNDVPEEVRQQLYAEEQKAIEKRQKLPSTSAANFPPINITNVMPAASYQTPPLEGSPAGTPVPDLASISAPAYRLDLPGPRDDAVEDYCAWQQSKVNRPTLKVEYQKACDVIIEDGMDLELIHQDPNPDFLIKRGIKRGIA